MNVQLIVNPLLSRKPLPISNWKQWLARWEETVSFQEMLGLLHFGFEVEMQSSHEHPYKWTDRILFFLSVADGWNNDNLLHQSDEPTESEYEAGYDKDGNRIRKTMKALRQDIALKAASLVFKQLLQIPVQLSGKYRHEINPEWESIFADDFFPLIQNFFRVEKSPWSNPEIRNLTSGHARHPRIQASLIEFISNLADAMWEWKKPSYFSNDQEKQEAEALQNRIDKAKPWMVEVLCRCGKVAKLEKWLLNLDEQCLEVIKNIALERSAIRKGSETIEEACYAGSQLAWLLIHHQVLCAEDTRIRKVREHTQILQKEDQRRRAIEEAEAEAAAALKRVEDLKSTQSS